MLALLTEHDEDYAAILAELLRRDGHEVIVANSLESSVRKIERQLPELAVVDVVLPDGSGLELARQLKAQAPELPLVLLSASERVSDIVAGFEAGADDYIAKPLHPSEFLARVRAVLRRCGYAIRLPVTGRAPIRGKGLEFDAASKTAYLDGHNLNCTRLEFDILHELASVPGQVLSHEFLNERVWNYSHLADGTLLKGHISSLRKKLRDVSGKDDTIRTVHGVGYSFTAA
jgi:DNA-binding response OmpR family regulator